MTPFEQNNLNNNLLTAVENGDTEKCATLLRDGAQVTEMHEDGWTPLDKAAENGFEDICKLLIDHGADVHAKYWWGATPLHKAAGNGHLEVCRLLVEHGANVKASNDAGRTPLHSAVMFGHIDVAHYFIETCGEDPHQKCSNGKTLIQLAETYKQTAMANFLSAYKFSLVTENAVNDALLIDAEQAVPTRSRSFSPL